jgi:prepilin signal peptidase PulO-like enzyme (type II secretory pathway)
VISLDFLQVPFLVLVLVDLAAIAVWDARFQIVPAVLIWPALALGLVFDGIGGRWGFLAAAAVAFALTAIPTLIWGENKAGLGDAQLYGLVGLALGWDVFAVLVMASLAAAAWGIARKRAAVPVAPFIAMATVAVMSLRQ